MYILTVIVLFIGNAEPTYTQKWTDDEAQCLMVADTMQDAFHRNESDIEFSIILCNPVSNIGE